MRILQVALLASLILGFSSIAAAQSSPQVPFTSCELIVMIDVDIASSDAMPATVCQGGWVVWLAKNFTNKKSVKVKLKDWRFKGTMRKADVTDFKHFGLFGGDEEETQGRGGGVTDPSAAVLVARARYRDLKRGYAQAFQYTIAITTPDGEAEHDPELVIAEPPVLGSGK